MRKRFMAALVALVLVGNLSAQEREVVDAVMRFIGVDSPEELDAAEVERLEDFLDHPLRINMVSQSRLAASGLLSPYQAASLSDYRARHGNVMSFTELSAVDGFGPDAVRKLRPFISLEYHQVHESVMEPRHDFALKSAYKAAGAPVISDWNYGLKYRLRTDRLMASVGLSRPYSAVTPWPASYTASFSCDFRWGRVVAGDFNARFGQGLALWSGAFMTSLSSPDAFMKKPSGISETFSFTGSSALTGIAGTFSMRRLTLTVLTAVPGIKSARSAPEKIALKPAANLSWRGRFGQVSLSHVMGLSGWNMQGVRIPSMRTSCDAAFCIRGVNVYGEALYDWGYQNIHAVAGTDFRISEIVRMAALVRYLPTRSEGTAAQHGVALSAAFGTQQNRHAGVLTADVVRYVEPKDKSVPHSIQAKLLGDWKFKVDEHWDIKLRLSERLRTWGYHFRTDLRADVSYVSEPWVLNMRMNALWCVHTGFVSYLEEGRKTSSMSIYLRQGIFLVDDWEDRIYVYERDAPGSFNVPAMYGRGWFAGAVASVRINRTICLYARASYTGYQFMPREKRKPGKAELKFQVVSRF